MIKMMSMLAVISGLVLLLATTQIHTLSDDDQVRCIERDRLALLTFKQGLVDPRNRLFSWTDSSNRDCCTWAGITCDNRTNHVVMLDLRGFDKLIGGEIGASLVNLQYLEHLDFSWNDFTRIPKFIGSFKRLAYLNLEWNPIRGVIPPQLGNLTELQFLILGGSSDGGMIADNLEWLSRLPSLTTFELRSTNFTRAGLQSFQMPPSLSTLEFHGCQFPQVDTSSFSHANSSASLEKLSVSYNSIHSTTVAWFLNSGRNLTHLELSNSMIGTLNPSQIGNLTKLEYLDLEIPMIADTLGWLSHLPSLKTFYLGVTNFTLDGLQSFKMPPSLSSLTLKGCHFPEVDSISSLSSANLSNSLTRLDLQFNTIHPTVLSWLLNSSPNLTDLGLSLNIGLGNKIPKSLGNLTNLQTLHLSGNKFNETLQDLLESLPGHSLMFLDLSENQLGGSILDDGKKFPSLRELYLYENLVEGLLPNSLSRFPNVVTLYLSSNRLTGSLPDLSSLSSLREFHAGDNRLNGTLTESIGKLQNLESLDLSNNSLSGVVSELHFQKLSKLKELILSSNSLTLSFNSNWVPPFQLTYLSLSSCKLGSKFPSWLHNQFNISYLKISNSGISGAIPHWFSNLTFKLEYLNLSFNLMNSTLPNFPLMSEYDHLVDLSSNQFHGPIPSSLSNAREVHLSNNNFTGLRSFLCDVRDGATEFLDLSNNLLFGSLPDCWRNLKDLSVLNLENNKLFGVIPRSLGLIHDIGILNLRKNSFSGSLPSPLKNCTQLQVLDVGENNLKGEIPSWIGERLINLVFLSLKSNRFFGNIPSNLCYLQSIKILDLSTNDISGPIPSCIDNFTSMVQKLDVEGTSLFVHVNVDQWSSGMYAANARVVWKGVEYKYEEILGLLRIIDLSKNRLLGEIPKELANLVELLQLNLSGNNLSGVIPEKIGKLNKLESLDLSHNKLSGNIPVSLAEVSTLDYLDLSSNQLSGRIPKGTQLQSLNASAYAENLGLCGQPLDILCPGDENSNDDDSYVEDGGEWFDMSWLRLGIGVGFAVGFCGVCGNLLLNASVRLAYFRLLDNLGDFLYVIIAVKWATIKRRFSN